MPLYEYQCADCGKVTEVIQKFSEDALTECPECGGHLEKLLSAPAIQFKGAGWYVTDYARKGGNGEGKGTAPKSKEKTEKKEESKSASSESKTTESGGAAKKGEASK